MRTVGQDKGADRHGDKISLDASRWGRETAPESLNSNARGAHRTKKRVAKRAAFCTVACAHHPSLLCVTPYLPHPLPPQHTSTFARASPARQHLPGAYPWPPRPPPPRPPCARQPPHPAGAQVVRINALQPLGQPSLLRIGPFQANEASRRRSTAQAQRRASRFARPLWLRTGSPWCIVP